MNETKTANRSANASDDGEYLCLCLNMTKARFQAAVAAFPDMTLDQLRQKTGLGTRCTACLLNSEVAFVEALRPGSRSSARTTRSSGWNFRRLSKDGLYAAIDRLSPMVPRRPVPWGGMSVIGGRHVSTILRIANDRPNGISEPPSPVAFDLRLRDQAGQIQFEDSLVVEAGKSVTRDISRYLPDADEQDIVWGYCDIRRYPLRYGSAGVSRPHMQFRTRRGVSHLHFIGGGIGRTTQVLMRYPGRFRYHLHAVNGGDDASTLELRVSGDRNSELLRIERSVAPHYGIAIELPPGPTDGMDPATQIVDLRSDPAMRFNLIVADEDWGHLVVEHLSR